MIRLFGTLGTFPPGTLPPYLLCTQSSNSCKQASRRPHANPEIKGGGTTPRRRSLLSAGSLPAVSALGPWLGDDLGWGYTDAETYWCRCRGGSAQALVEARTSAPSYTDERSSVRRHTGAWKRWISRFRPRAHPLRKLRFSRLETVQLALRDAQVRTGQAEGGVPGSDRWRCRSRSGGGLRNADAPPVRRRVRGGHSPNWCLRAPERDEKRLPTASASRSCPKGARC